MTSSTGSDATFVTTTVGDGIGVLTLRHPPLNILTHAVLEALRGALDTLAADPAVRVLLVEAEGPHFSAGADVAEHLPPHERVLIPHFMATIRALNEFPLPVIAAVRGRCLGGGFEVAQAADFIVAGASATFGQPEIVLGVTAPAACALLAARAGAGLAASLLFSGDSIDAETAKTAGLVRSVVPDESLGEEARRQAGRIARHSRTALMLTKKSLRGAAHHHEAEALQRSEAIYLGELMSTHDAIEGLEAFVQKRRPAWTHQ